MNPNNASTIIGGAMILGGIAATALVPNTVGKCAGAAAVIAGAAIYGDGRMRIGFDMAERVLLGDPANNILMEPASIDDAE